MNKEYPIIVGVGLCMHALYRHTCVGENGMGKVTKF